MSLLESTLNVECETLAVEISDTDLTIASVSTYVLVNVISSRYDISSSIDSVSNNSIILSIDFNIKNSISLFSYSDFASEDYRPYGLLP
jgi:hypothetical protein